MTESVHVHTPSHDCLVDITAQVQSAVSRSGVTEGVCFVFVPHTTAGLAINENADPTVCSDIVKTMSRIVPWEDDYDHTEGNSAAHLKASMFGQSHFVLVSKGRLQLGTWQGIYLAEFDGPRQRQVWVRTTQLP
jgi:secondary thiamine-phosphate synthase enzyme